MPVGSSYPTSPMALSRSSSPASSIFKKGSSPSPPTSAKSYLSALSTRARNAQCNSSPPPNSTPALSLSSSFTASTDDTLLTEADLDNSHGLALPVRPPTSEQNYTTVHTEFGHCSNEEYRRTSSHTPGTPVPSHVERDPPYYILLSTYISYLILIVLGHVRDFLGKRFYPKSYRDLMPRDVRL